MTFEQKQSAFMHELATLANQSEQQERKDDAFKARKAYDQTTKNYQEWLDDDYLGGPLN